MFGNSMRVMRILGIDIRVDASWLVIFALVSWSLAVGYFPQTVPGLGRGTAILLGIAAALLFFGSVLLHELSHSLVARARGIGVRSITLFIFGGVSTLSGDARSPGTEFMVAIVGPLTSLAIAGVALAGSAVLDTSATDGTAAVPAVLGYVGVVNGLVGIFNLIPGFPLDGGRVLRSILWRLSGSMPGATRIAGFVGQLVAFGFIVWGVFRIADGDLVGGVWIAAIGWFLRSAASASVQQLKIDESLRGLRVRDVFRPEAVWVRPEASVQDVVDQALVPYNRDRVAVAGDGLLGIVTLRDIARVPFGERPMTRVGQLVARRPPLPTVGPDDELSAALEALEDLDESGPDAVDQIPVVEGGQLVGFLGRADVERAIQLREGLRRAA